MSSYSLILRACPDGSREAVAQLLGRAFSLKDSTCVSIAGSTPIVLLTDLTKDEAAALSFAMASLEHKGATVEFSNGDASELPKIDWPRRPMVFKREIAEHVGDCALVVPIPGTGKTYSLLDLLIARLDPTAARVSGPHASAKGGEYKGSHLPEVTPFSNQVLPPVPSAVSAPSASRASTSSDADAVSRLNELFPEEEAGFMPNNDDITSILDRLLPDEEKVPGSAAPAGAGSGSGRMAVASVAAQGYSVFLAKIADEGRRAKVVTLLVELAKFSQDDAEALSKKVIIPVLKGVSKDQAENAKQRFAKIGILARVKGPEG